MLNAIGVIARARFLVMRNSLWRGKIGRKIAWVALAIALAFLAFGVYSLMSIAVGFFGGDEFRRLLERAAATTPGVQLPTDLRVYLRALPSVALFGALLALVLTSFSTVLSSLYLSGDIDMLLVAPVPMRSVFVVKFFGGLVLPYLLLFVLAAPALLGYGTGMRFGPAYYIAAVLALILLPLIPFSVGALLVMAVVRVIPARRAREMVGLLSGLVGIAWYILSQFSRQLGRQVSSVGTAAWLERLNNPFLPSAWAGRALNAAGEGEWLTLLGFGGLFAAVSIGAFLGALILGEKVYYEGWSNMAAQGGRVRRKTESRQQQAPNGLVARLGSLLPRESAAILYKDVRVFPRDLRNLQQLIFPLVMAGIWTFNLVAQGPNRDAYDEVSAAAPFFALLAPAGITAFICLTMSVALGGPNISREGKGYWQLKLAPVSAWKLLIGKFALAYVPYPIVGTLLIGLITLLQHNTPLNALVAWLLVQISGLGVCAIALGMGAAFPKFNWEKPSDQNSIQSGCLAPIFYMLYLALTIGAVVGLPIVGTLLPGWGAAFTTLGWLIALVLTTAVVWGFMAFGARRLDRLEVG